MHSLTQINKAPPAIENLFNAFIAYVDATPQTIRTYKGHLRQFLKYLAETGTNQPTRETIIDYREHLKSRCKATTVQNYIAAVKIFFNWTEQEGLYPNIAKHIKGAKISKEHKKDYLTSEQLKRLFSSIDQDTPQGKRDFALIALMVTGGLRDIEVHRANIGDIGSSGSAKVLYIQGKGKDEKASYIKIPLKVELAIRDYLKTRDSAEPQEPLFVSMSNNSKSQRLSTRSISGIVKNRLINAGYDSDRLTAHSLRHSAITISLLEGNSLQETQFFARHSSIVTTQIYAQNLDRASLKCEESIARSIFE